MVEESLCQLPKGWIIVGLITIILVMLLGTFGNFLVCIVLLKLKPTEATFSSTFVFSVAFSDLLTCLTVLPFDVIYWVYFPVWILSPAICKIWNSLFFTFISCSALSLTEVAVDMYIAVSRPLHYRIYVTKFRTRILVSLTWIWSIGVGVFVFLRQEEPPQTEYLFELDSASYGSYLLLHMAIPCILVIIVYLKLFYIARDHAVRLKITPGKSTQSKEMKEGKKDPPKDKDESLSKRKNNSRKLRIREELKLAQTFGLVATMFFVCWAPFFVVQLIYVFKLEPSVDACALEIADTVVCWFAYIQCCINPILYAFRHRTFRRSMRRVIWNSGTLTRVFTEAPDRSIGITNFGYSKSNDKG